jgi:hypothetical protein
MIIDAKPDHLTRHFDDENQNIMLSMPMSIPRLSITQTIIAEEEEHDLRESQ